MFADLRAFVQDSAYCTECQSTVPADLFNAEMNRLFDRYLAQMWPGEEERGENVAAPIYQALVDGIRERARTAPPEEGWPPRCMGE